MSVCSLPAFDIARIDISRLGTGTPEPPLDVLSVYCPEKEVVDVDPDNGLPHWVLPKIVNGRVLDAESVHSLKTMCGLRFVYGVYGGDVIIEVIRAPLSSEKVHVMYSDYFGDEKSWRSLYEYLHDLAPDGIERYKKSHIESQGNDLLGVQWFTIKGRSNFRDLRLPGVRYGIWWRKDNWVFGVDAGSRRDRDLAVGELMEYLAGLE